MTGVRLRMPGGVRRLGWGVVDQAASSLTNVLVTFAVAKFLGARDFGAFSLAYVTYAVVLSASRGLTTDPLIVRYSHRSSSAWRRATADCSGAATVIGAAAGVLVCSTALFMSEPTRGAFLALGLCLPLLMLQDSWRYAFFAAGRGERALVNDVVWGVGVVVALLGLHRLHLDTPFWYMLAWGTAGGVAAVVGMRQARTLPRLGGIRRWLLEHRDLGTRYMAEGLTSNVATQLRIYGVGLLLGLAAVGHVQAAASLMGPFLIVMFGSNAVMVPELKRAWLGDPVRLVRLCLLFGGGLAVLAVLWCVALLILLPGGLGDLVLGSVWQSAYPLLPAVTVAMMGGSFQAAAGMGLRTLAAARSSLQSMIVSSVILVVLGIGGAVAGGTVGTVWGAALAAWLGAAVWWAALRRDLQPAALRSGHGSMDPGASGPSTPSGRVPEVAADGTPVPTGPPPRPADRSVDERPER